ncbi:MAG: aminopeptidase P family protein [Oscillospiraceae bacterium]|nr:aminopeptidase P family protein [Oscillospiraceae bacterium]
MGFDIEALRSQLPPGTVAYIDSSTNRRYCTGFTSSAGILLITADNALFLTDCRYIEAAQEKITLCPVREVSNKKGELCSIIQALGANRVILERQTTTLSAADNLTKRLDGLSVDTADNTLSDFLAKQRMVKDAAELSNIREAQRIAEAALKQLLPDIQPGETETVLARRLSRTMEDFGAQSTSFDTIFASGPNGALPHAVPGNRKIVPGDAIVVDFGCMYNDYCSDYTRTIFVGAPSPEQTKVYGIVREAQAAAIAAVKPGVPCKEIDKIARDIITAAGYGKQFRHSTGHGVGLEIHEDPGVSSVCETKLQPGMVITVEPGIYLPGKFGVRIENMVAVTADGCEVLGEAAVELSLV